MPMYQSRFATNMTTHTIAGLRTIGPRQVGPPVLKLPYHGPERQCQAVRHPFPEMAWGPRCPHAVRWVREGAFICGVCAMTHTIHVVEGS